MMRWEVISHKLTTKYFFSYSTFNVIPQSDPWNQLAKWPSVALVTHQSPTSVTTSYF